MGMRQNIELNYGVVEMGHGSKIPQRLFIYSHWDGGGALLAKLRTALAKELRWDDQAYLTRMIVSEVIKDDIEGETGYGIAPYQMDQNVPNIVVDLCDKTVDGVPFADFILTK